MNFFCTDADGIIVRAGTCPDDQLAAQAGPGETAREGVANIWTQYWDGAALQNYSPELVATRTQFQPGFRWTLAGWVDERSLQQLKNEKWVEIKAARRAAEFSTFVHNGNEYDCDETSAQRIMGAVQMAVLANLASEAFSITWTLANNDTVVLDAAAMIAVGLALSEHVQSQHVKARTLRQQINTAATAASVATIAW